MPNGGIDNCGTCQFNSNNICILRNVNIENPFYTYCANHPIQNPNIISILIGPVFVGDSSGNREVWIDSPDTEEIREQILEILKTAREQPITDYQHGYSMDEVAVWQAGEFKEKRAIEELERIRHFKPDPSNSNFIRVVTLVGLSGEALEKIKGSSDKNILIKRKSS